MSNVTPIRKRSAQAKSRVSNGTRSLIEGDERTVWARRFKDLIESFEADQGDAPLSEAKRSLIRSAATMCVELERMTADASQGKPFNIEVYGRSAGNYRRLLEAIGLERHARDVSPTTPHQPLVDHFSRPVARGGV